MNASEKVIVFSYSKNHADKRVLSKVKRISEHGVESEIFRSGQKETKIVKRLNFKEDCGDWLSMQADA